MDIKKIKDLINELSLLNFIDNKFKINNWYIENDDMRMTTNIFKVLDIDKDYVYFKSLDGKLELIDEQETKLPAFSRKSLTDKRSEELNKDEALIWIKKQLAKELE